MSRKMYKWMSIIRNNKGMALVAVLVVSTVLALTGNSYLSTSGMDSGMVNKQASRAQAMYAAEAGLEMAKRKFSATLCGGDPLGDSQIYTNDRYNIPGHADPLKLKVQLALSGDNYIASSGAELPNGTKAKVTANLTEDPNGKDFPLYGYGIYAKEVVHGEPDTENVDLLIRVCKPIKGKKWGLWHPEKDVILPLKQSCSGDYSTCHQTDSIVRKGHWYYGPTGYWKSRIHKSTGLTATVLTDSHADFKWRGVNLNGWRLVPDTRYDTKYYPIVAHDRHTVTVTGDMLAGGAAVGNSYRIEKVLADSDPGVTYYTYNSNKDAPENPVKVEKEDVVKEGTYCFPTLTGNGFNEAAFIPQPPLPEPLIDVTLDCGGYIAQDPGNGNNITVNSLCKIKEAMAKHRTNTTKMTVSGAIEANKSRVYVMRGNTDSTKNSLLGKNNTLTLEGSSILKFPDGGLTIAHDSEWRIKGANTIIEISGQLHLGYKSKLYIEGNAYLVIDGHMRLERQAVLECTGNLYIISKQSNKGDWVDSDPAIFLGGGKNGDSKWNEKGSLIKVAGNLEVYNPNGDLVIKRKSSIQVAGNASFNVNNFIVKRKGDAKRPKSHAPRNEKGEEEKENEGKWKKEESEGSTLLTKCDKTKPHSHFEPSDDEDDDEDRDADGNTDITKGQLAQRESFCRGHHFAAKVTQSRGCAQTQACHTDGSGKGKWAKIWWPKHEDSIDSDPFGNDAFRKGHKEVYIQGETTIAAQGGIYLYNGNLYFGKPTTGSGEDTGKFTTLVSRGDMHIRNCNVVFNGEADIDAGDGSLGANGEPEDSFILGGGKYGAIKFGGQTMIEHKGSFIDMSETKLAIGDEVQIYGNHVINVGSFGLPKISKVKKIKCLSGRRWPLKRVLPILARFRWYNSVDEVGSWVGEWKDWRDAKYDDNKYQTAYMKIKDPAKLVIINTGDTADGAYTRTKRTFFGHIYSPNAEVEVADLPAGLEDVIPSYMWGAIASNETVTVHNKNQFYFDKALKDAIAVKLPAMKVSSWRSTSYDNVTPTTPGQ